MADVAVPGRLPADLQRLVRAAKAGAEAVDRGERSLAPEIDLLHRAWLLQPRSGVRELFPELYALGGASLPLARLFEGHHDALDLVLRLGSDTTRAKTRRLVDDGGLLGVWGADAPGDPVTATVGKGDVLRLAGRKAFASGLGLVRAAVLSVRMPGGCQLLLVDATDAQRHNPASWDVDAMVGTVSGQFSLAGLEAQPDDRLGAIDAFYEEPFFHGGLWRIAAIQAGAVNGLAQGLRGLLVARGQMDNPLQRQRLAHVVRESLTAKLWAEAAASAMEGQIEDRSIETPLFAREAIEHAATSAMEQLARASGTALHSRTEPLARQVRDLRLYLRQASLDDKLGFALQLWLDRHRRQPPRPRPSM